MPLAQRLNTGLRSVPAWPIYPLAAAWAAWLFYLAFTGGLGVDPVRELEHRLGLLALQCLIAGLAITPLRRFAGINLLHYRRAIGLVAFLFVTLHLAAWLVFDIRLLWEQIWKDILKRPYITIGMIGFLAMVPLALTSNNWSMRRLGPLTWRRLHRLTHVAALAGGAHYLLVVKSWPLEPILYFCAILVLLALRLIPARRNSF